MNSFNGIGARAIRPFIVLAAVAAAGLGAPAHAAIVFGSALGSALSSNTNPAIPETARDNKYFQIFAPQANALETSANLSTPAGNLLTATANLTANFSGPGALDISTYVSSGVATSSGTPEFATSSASISFDFAFTLTSATQLELSYLSVRNQNVSLALPFVGYELFRNDGAAGSVLSFGDATMGSFSLLLDPGSYGFSLRTSATTDLYQNGVGQARTMDQNAYSNVSFRLFAPSVPEPASWATMLLGFGLTGAVARRRPRAVTA